MLMMEDTKSEEIDKTENNYESPDKSESDVKNRESASKSTSQESDRLNVTKSVSSPSSRDGSGARMSRSRSRSPDSRRTTSSSGTDQTRSSRKKKKSAAAENTHKVTFTITISQAINKYYTKSLISDGRYADQQKKITSSLGKRSGKRADTEEDGSPSRKRTGRILEQPKAQNYFHFEYYLLPDDAEPVKTDVVTFGVAAKIYTVRHEPKVIKTWVDGDVTWIAWTDSHTVHMTDETLEKMTTHTLELRVWDTRDKLSAKARFDRPKAFRLPQTKPGDDNENSGTKGLVMKQANNFEKSQPKISYINRPLPPFSEAAGFQVGKLKHQESATRRSSTNKCKKGSPVPQTNPTSPTETLEPPTEDGLPLSSHGDGSGDVMSKRRTLNSAQSSGTGQSEKRGKSRRVTAGNKSIQSKTSVSCGDPARRARNAATTSRSPAPKPQRPKTSVETDSKQKSYSRLGRLAGLDRTQDTASKAASGGGDRSQARESRLDRQSKALTKSTVDFDLNESNGAGKTKSRKNKKGEAGAQAAAELIKKNGICCIPIKMSSFFCSAKTTKEFSTDDGTTSCTNRMKTPISGLEDVFFSVTLNNPLMSDEQKKKLNPLIIKVQSANDMPNTPLSFADLQTKCLPTYVQYQLLKFPVHRSIGRPQAPDIYWDDTKVILAGKLDVAELRQFLYGPPLQIEIHDRDRVVESQPLKPTLFGDDLEDEKISNVGTVSSKRTLHNPFSGRDKPWDPYGVAEFDLSGLLLGQQVLNLQTTIRQCAVPDILGLKDGKHSGKLIGVPGAVDGPTDAPLPPGHYLDHSSVLKIKVEIAHPLVTCSQLAANQPLPTSAQCPFARIVFKFDYKNVGFLSQLQSLVTELNSSALKLDHLPPHVIEAALSTYKLSVDQQKSSELDIVTGFQLLDGEMHLFVLEGLQSGGIQRLWDSLPKPENSDVEILYHSDLSFTERLYGPLDVDVCRIKLHEPLSRIVQQPLLYVRDMVPKACFEALIKLGDLSKQSRLRDAVRNSMFPSAEMVISMSREFGVPLTAEDFEDLKPISNEDTESATKDVYYGSKPSREWTPIDHYNGDFEEHLRDRTTTGDATDYIAENKDSIRRQSELNFIERSKTMPVTIRVNVPKAHNYSAQTLNSTEMAKEKLRQELAKNPDIRYTYCPEYHHSMTVVPVNTEALRKKENEDLIKAFRSPAGWTYPGKKTMIQSNVHPKKPDAFRTKQLYQPWAENTLHSTMLEPPLERDRFQWEDREADFDTWTYPNRVFNPQDPITIQLAGEKLKQEKLDAKKQDRELWQSKVVVEDTSMRFWRCATETELKDRGFKSSNQLERLRGVLKDPPHKLSFKKPGVSIPPLCVVQNPSVDTDARLAGLSTRPAVPNEGNWKVKGFKPGPQNELSWARQGNHIPCTVYEHEKFKRQKGTDFNVYHRDRPRHYKRHIEPLSDVEYSRHLFRWPQQAGHYNMMAPNALAYQAPDLNEFQRNQPEGTQINEGIAYHQYIAQPHNTTALLET